MMLGITAVSTSTTQFKLAGNLQFDDAALNSSETAISTAETWLSTGTNYKNAGFTTYNAGSSPQLRPIATLLSPAPNPLTMTWDDSTSIVVPGTTARYFIQLLSANNVLLGSSQAVGGRASSVCNSVSTFAITARGGSARGAVKYVQTYYSVLNC